MIQKFRSTPFSTPGHQTGMALLIALIMLVVMTLLALSAVRFSSLEIKMASNDELIAEAFQKAVSVADATIANPANTPVTGAANYTLCTPGHPTTVPACDAYTITLPDSFESAAVAAGKVKVKSVLVNPQQSMTRSLGTGFGIANYAAFRIEGDYDRSSEGLGRDAVKEGIWILLVGNLGS